MRLRMDVKKMIVAYQNISAREDVPRKSGRALFTRGPEYLDQLYFHALRKSCNAVFTRNPQCLDQLY
jgi:hypothetical protein